MEFSRPEYWPSPGDLPNPGTEPRSPTLQTESLAAKPQGKTIVFNQIKCFKLWSGTEKLYSFYPPKHLSEKTGMCFLWNRKQCVSGMKLNKQLWVIYCLSNHWSVYMGCDEIISPQELNTLWERSLCVVPREPKMKLEATMQKEQENNPSCYLLLSLFSCRKSWENKAILFEVFLPSSSLRGRKKSVWSTDKLNIAKTISSFISEITNSIIGPFCLLKI